jgi:hypothetical protein
MALMGAGILSVSLLGAQTTFADLMPGFAIIGIGGGLTIPLTSTILKSMPVDRAGVASAVFNSSREVAGLLGITIIGVILRARQTTEIHLGHPAITAFLSGYRLGLVVADSSSPPAGSPHGWRCETSTPTVEPRPSPGKWRPGRS